ncbi:MAG: hypothetical protein KBT88_10475 [Gammaproteobacteria bacterium]|nr:hypothetical protein [Gammaproteobacteria bacterium]MBQ0840200.1 hypothetical protein [Gammaproteobacteria bacterium]
MYTPENYFWGCFGYVLGVLMATPFIWWATQRLPWYPLRAFLRMLSLAVLLTPAFPYAGMSYLAPAWATAAFELIRPTMEHGVRRVLMPIGFSFALLYALNLCVWQLRKARAEKQAGASGSAGGDENGAQEDSVVPS